MSSAKKLYRLIECCLNWRVIVGLALIGTALFVYAPKLALAYVPVLLALICPVSMLVMMFAMDPMKMGRPGQESEPAPALENLSRDKQLQLLEDRMERIQRQHRAIASLLADTVDSKPVAS